MNELSDKGVGCVCIHYGVEVPKGDAGDNFLKWIGGYFETHWSVNPHWTAEFAELPKHEITEGVKPFKANDEWYYHMRFREEMKGVTPLLSALPPKETLTRRDGPHSGNPHVRKAVLEDKAPQHVAWCSENENGSRGFGFTGGHNHWNWGNDNNRKLVLNAIVWCAKGTVPEGGVGSKKVTLEDLEKNQDFTQPKNFKRDDIKKRFELTSSGKKAPRKKGAKPIFTSKTLTPKVEGHITKIEANIKGAKELYLVMNDAGNGYSCDWGVWIEPKLVGDGISKNLTDMKWASAGSDFGSPQVGKNCIGGPLKVNGKSVSGIGTHANSVIYYKLPEGHKFTKFTAMGGLDNGGTDQGACGEQTSVQFQIFTAKPVLSGGTSGTRDPEDAIAGLDIADDVDIGLFAAEPDIFSLANIDIDDKGRVWCCEIINYRRHNGKRPEGDRIVICQDTDGDGASDKTTVFYQGKEIDSAHGICVLPTASGKGTKAIVSANDKVMIFTDENGDLKSDKMDILFTGISGTQHDHGIHAFVFGPDGKLYFNFGNAGRQIKDKNGKPIVDKAGNEVNVSRKPYQEGMVFRCNMDGSEFETLGWNFRNNWEVAVDSFGDLWQSDNDDDGNRGVRINFVMEFGNYGYKDEFTGAGWKSKRTNIEKEIPQRHWHLNDPGVVPNLLQTGGGSPTGILVYEGALLPKRFRNQIIHCDAGPNIVRAYPRKNAGAGFTATMAPIVEGTRDKWFRPSDVCVAPDGSLFIADWYDPGVGGHGMGDLDRGRIFRVAPENSSYTTPKFDYSTAEGAVEALKSPNMATRYIAWTTLHAMGEKAIPALEKLWAAKNNVYRARALWLLSKISNDGKYIAIGAKDENPRIRTVAIRLARQAGTDIVPFVTQMQASEKSPAVRRELAIALRGQKGEAAAKAWANLASKHNGKDRWYLEALGIAASGNWDACMAAYIEQVGAKTGDAAYQDIVWRSRAKNTPMLIAKILTSDNAPQNQDRFMRAFDFHNGPEKDKALESLLELDLEE